MPNKSHPYFEKRWRKESPLFTPLNKGGCLEALFFSLDFLVFFAIIQ
jgi:hypothetical protein